MIYIIKQYDNVSEGSCIIAVIETDLDIKNIYNEFVYAKAKEMDIVINRHWLNIMNHEDHNTHLTKSEYKKKRKEWEKFLKQNTFLNFAKSELRIIPKEFKTIYNS